MDIETKEKKPQFKEGIDWISKVVAIETMYRIKGKQGLFMPITKPNKSGLISMIRFMSTERYTVNKSLLEGLRGVVIYTNSNKTIALTEAFDNLQNHFDNQPTGELDASGKDALMDVVCPDYDKDRFKDYHAKKIIQWYNEMVTKINIASN